MTGRAFYTDKGNSDSLPAAECLTESEHDSEGLFVDGKAIGTHPTLESYSRETRTWVADKATKWIDIFNSYKAQAASQVAKADSHYHQLIVEPLLPQSLYVITAALAGSVLATRRSLAVRFLSPVFLGIVSFGIFMPKSFSNCYKSVSEVEARHFPELKQKQVQIGNKVSQAVTATNDFIGSFQPMVTDVVKEGREAVEDWLRKK